MPLFIVAIVVPLSELPQSFAKSLLLGPDGLLGVTTFPVSVPTASVPVAGIRHAVFLQNEQQPRVHGSARGCAICL